MPRRTFLKLASLAGTSVAAGSLFGEFSPMARAPTDVAGPGDAVSPVAVIGFPSSSWYYCSWENNKQMLANLTSGLATENYQVLEYPQSGR